jgi:hypothetical protein
MALGMPLTIATGILFGAMLVPIGTAFADWLIERYDLAFPVVAMHGTLMSISDNEATITLQGRKLRKCGYIRLRAYAIDGDGDMHDTYIARVDVPETGETRPTGEFSSGMWRVWPLPNSRGIVVYANHLCGSRIVVTKVADIDLTKAARK